MKWYTNNDVFHFYDMCVCVFNVRILKKTFLFLPSFVVFILVLFKYNMMAWYSNYTKSEKKQMEFYQQHKKRSYIKKSTEKKRMARSEQKRKTTSSILIPIPNMTWYIYNAHSWIVYQSTTILYSMCIYSTRWIYFNADHNTLHIFSFSQ